MEKTDLLSAKTNTLTGLEWIDTVWLISPLIEKNMFLTIFYLTFLYKRSGVCKYLSNKEVDFNSTFYFQYFPFVQQPGADKHSWFF